MSLKKLYKSAIARLGLFYRQYRAKKWLIRSAIALFAAFCSANSSLAFMGNGDWKKESKILPSVPAIASSQSPIPNSEQFLQQGREFFQAEQFSQAKTIWQQAVDAFKASGDRLNQALSLSYLSLAYQQLGQWQAATEAIASSLSLLQTNENNHSTDRLSILAQALNTQGHLQLALGESESALTTWQKAADTYSQINDTEGAIGSQINQVQALQALGLYRRAIETLKKVEGSLQNQPDSQIKATGFRSLGNALRAIGELDKSREFLQESLIIAQKLQLQSVASAAQFSLGNTARALAKRAEDLKDKETAKTEIKIAIDAYKKAAEMSRSHKMQLQAQLNQFSLLTETQQLNDAEMLRSPILSQLNELSASRWAVYAKINFAQSLIKLENWQNPRGGFSRESFDRTENLSTKPASTVSANTQEVAQLLATAIQQAKSLKDSRSESHAIGNLGELYELTGQLQEAQNLTQESLALAQAIDASDIAYRWQWQLGRLKKEQGDRKGAIAAYTIAVETLQSLRSDLVAVNPDNPDVQFSFRESVEPVYRELVDLLLNTKEETSQENLRQARQAIESLQLAELDNFFQEACLDIQPVQIDKIDAKAAVIYPIILKDRLEVILALPQSPLRHYSTYKPQREIEIILDELQQDIGRIAANNQKVLQLSQQVYDWLIRPAEAVLEAQTVGAGLAENLSLKQITSQQNPPLPQDAENLSPKQITSQQNPPLNLSLKQITSQQNPPLPQDAENLSFKQITSQQNPPLQQDKVQTLVFVLDGLLRNIPMAALHDGQQYLIEKYNIALTPGLQLLAPQTLAKEQLKVLTAGLSEARQNFSSLPNVEQELKTIKSEFPNSLVLLNQDFTDNNLQKKINLSSFPVVHIATHGQFSSQSKDTFILTWDGEINVKDLDNLLRKNNQGNSNPIELLVFSACETADGDDRAALGLAGVAVRAGARSTLATLWRVSDRSTSALMTEFYRELANEKGDRDTSITKAQALRNAQLTLLRDRKYKIPYYWAPYILIGNWQ